MEKNTEYDVIIIGGGPAGLTAAIYALRSGLRTLLFEKAMIGGQTVFAPDVKNYPGFVSVRGSDLCVKMHQQATEIGLVTEYEEVVNFIFKTQNHKAVTASGKTYMAKTIILAMGAHARKLNVPGEKEFNGKGVAYCAVCDGAFFKDASVVVAGAGNGAAEEALYLSKIAKQVTIISNRKRLKMHKVLLDELKSKKDIIKIMYCSEITEIKGGRAVNGVVVKNIETEEETEIPASGVFVSIGRVPDTDKLKGKIELDDKGYILVTKHMETNISGVFACGDATHKELRQIITACSDGAVAATSAGVFVAK